MGETIELKAADGFSLSAYVAGPADAARGIVVVQEIFGVNRHIRNVADRFAAQGYAVVAPALFDRVQRGVELGYIQADIDRGREYRMKLSEAEVIKDIEAVGGPPVRQEAGHRRLLLRRHGGVVGGHPDGEVRGGVRVVWRRCRRYEGRAAERSGAVSFRREGRVNSRAGCRCGSRGAAESGHPRVSGRAARVRLRRARQLQPAGLRIGAAKDLGVLQPTFDLI